MIYRPTSPILYYIGLVLYMLDCVSMEIAWKIPLIGIAMILSIICLSFHCILTVSLYKHHSILIFSMVFLLVLVVGTNSHQLNLFISSFMLIFGAKSLEYNKILKIHFLTGASILLISILGAKTGFIHNVVVYRGGFNDVGLFDSNDTPRQSLGFVWPTNMAIHTSFVLLCYWLLRRAKLSIFDFILYLFATFILVRETNTRQMIPAILSLPICSWIISRNGNELWKNIVIKYLSIWIIPIFAVISLWMTLAFDNSNETWMVIDVVSSGRLTLGHDAIEKYGIPLFGQFVKMYGAEANINDYNYIDCSYIQSLVLWGWLMTILLLSIYVYICKQAYQRRDMPMLYAVFVVGLSSLTSQDLFLIVHCPFLLALFAKHKDYNNNISWQRKKLSLKTLRVAKN